MTHGQENLPRNSHHRETSLLFCPCFGQVYYLGLDGAGNLQCNAGILALS